MWRNTIQYTNFRFPCEKRLIWFFLSRSLILKKTHPQYILLLCVLTLNGVGVEMRLSSQSSTTIDMNGKIGFAILFMFTELPICLFSSISDVLNIFSCFYIFVFLFFTSMHFNEFYIVYWLDFDLLLMLFPKYIILSCLKCVCSLLFSIVGVCKKVNNWSNKS